MNLNRAVNLILIWSGFFTFTILYVNNFKQLNSEAAGWLGFLIFLYGASTFTYTCVDTDA